MSRLGSYLGRRAVLSMKNPFSPKVHFGNVTGLTNPGEKAPTWQDPDYIMGGPDPTAKAAQGFTDMQTSVFAKPKAQEYDPRYGYGEAPPAIDQLLGNEQYGSPRPAFSEGDTKGK